MIFWFGRRFGALAVWFLGLAVVVVVACCVCFVAVLLCVWLLWRCFSVDFLIVIGGFGCLAFGFCGVVFWVLRLGLLLLVGLVFEFCCLVCRFVLPVICFGVSMWCWFAVGFAVRVYVCVT